METKKVQKKVTPAKKAATKKVATTSKAPVTKSAAKTKKVATKSATKTKKVVEVEPVIKETATKDVIETPNESTMGSTVAIVESASGLEGEKAPEKKKRVKKNLEWYFHNEKHLKTGFNVRQMKILGWGLMLVTAFASGLSMYFDAHSITNLDLVVDVFNDIGALSVAALMIAAFAHILQHREDSYKMVISNGVAAIGIFLGFCLGYFVYFGCSMAHIGNIDYIASLTKIDNLIAKVFKNGLKFNVFIDLFLFSLFNFFLFYTPKKLENKKGELRAFRWLAVIPLLYVLAAFICNIYKAAGVINYTTWAYILLPTKSPMMFLSLSTVALIIKHRERKLKIKYNHSEEEYAVFFKSQSNSWLVSKTFAWCLFIFGLLDLIISIVAIVEIMLLGSALETIPSGSAEYEQVYNTMTFLTNALNTTGVGTAATQILFAPFVLMFSFNKTYETKKIDSFVPLLGIAGVALVYVNWVFIIIMTMNFAA